MVEIQADPPEPQLAEEGEEQEDVIAFDPLPATFLLAEKPLSYSDVPDGQIREPVFRKIALLMPPASVLASEEFDHRLQIEDLYEANSFRGRAIAFAKGVGQVRVAAKRMPAGFDGRQERAGLSGLRKPAQRHTPHPVPLPMGEGTPSQKLRTGLPLPWGEGWVRGNALWLWHAL